MLETKIEALTKAVEALTAALLIQQAAPLPAPKPAPKAAPVAEPEQPAEEAPMATITRDDLQDWALAKVREDKTFKVQLMAALKEYNAKTISQLPDNAVLDVYVKLGGGV
jgi:hypothetical protein